MNLRKIVLRAAGGLGLGVFLLCAASHAQVQQLEKMQHESWAGYNGAPQGLNTVSMDSNGLLWIASLSGVYSFDGNTFSRLNPTDGGAYVNSSFKFILFTRQGDLWLTGNHGAPVRVRKGIAKRFDRTDCGSIDVMQDPQESPTGVLWARVNGQKLVTLGDDGIWHRVEGPEKGTEHITKLHVDARGTVWVVAGDRLYIRPAGQPGFTFTDHFIYGGSSFAEGIHADLWVASSGPATSKSPALHLQHFDASGRTIPTRRIKEPLFAVSSAPDGSIWIFTTGSVLAHLPLDALSSDGDLSIASWKDRTLLHTAVQDAGGQALFSRDGAIWIAGMGGIERFADAALAPLVVDAIPGLWDNCVQSDGTQYVKDPYQELTLRTPQQQSARVLRRDVEALYCSTAGDFFRDQQGLWVLHGDKVTSLPALPGLAGYSNHYIFTGAVRTPDGEIVATAAGAAIGRSLWTYRAGKWSRLGPVQDLPEITAMHALLNGQVYLGFRDGSVALLKNGALEKRNYTQPDLGGIVGFAETRLGPFAYGVHGIASLRDGPGKTLRFARPELARLVTGLVEARDGGFWLNAESGIVRIAADEIAAAVRTPTHQILSHNIREGNFVGPSYPSLFSDRAQIDGSGRVWFSTLNGIVSVAPNAVRSQWPPQLVINDVLADGHQLSAKRSFPPDVSMVSIAYFGIDYTNPTGLTYAYRLDGYDDRWQEVGGRTEAVYTHLKAGHYTFQVKARNAFGLWSQPASLKPFTVLPHFYERLWFEALCLCACAGLIWLGIQLRLRMIAANIRTQAEARADERISIARDLHDTLLQGVQGVLMSLHAATERVPPNQEGKQNLMSALASAERLVIEGRDRVKGLRALSISGKELGEAFEGVADDLGCRKSVQIITLRPDESVTLADHVASEVFLIGREALLNAYQHAKATRIVVQLNYASTHFSLECEDNGTGFEPETGPTFAHNGRYGIRGMRERAEKLHGTFEVTSERGKGSHLRLFLKARFAYIRESSGGGSRRVT